ncbi:acriflavine resistance protein B [Pararhodobacter marinus]|uniref:Acriflavine resistance protein B n=2 Tax=Pararhodobacter marinus TaxID=2184063 RepID=A0A2U2C934_9RHOB|nr:efflux RND transporter permease subunit [Pararhodobacter marinus]PWE28304.1 acriflavine resistance protein B [Pararhodobacter marinus]
MARDKSIISGAFGLFRYFTRHRTAANLVLVLMLAAGLLSLPRMHAQFFPDVVVDSVSVSIAWPGAGSGDVDAAIVQVVEPALMAVEGVMSTETRATEGRASFSLEFEPGWDIERATADVEDAIDSVSTLPEEAEDARILRSTWRDRVTNVIISGPVSIEQLALFTDEFVARLFAAGITRASIQGIASPEISVEVPSMRLVQYDVTMAEIAAAIDASVSVDPSGELSGGAQRVRTGQERRNADEIRAIVLRSAPDGSTLTVGDVADVREEAVDRDLAYYSDAGQALTVRVDRSENGDAIGIQETVQTVADEMTLSLPEGTTIMLANARADMISGRLNILVSNGLQGLGLVVVLLFLFLNARTALWVAAGIPVSMLAAVAFMYATGMSLNMISLFALIITLGIVVDDAIVVGEHADWRFRVLKESPFEAAENAATRMGLPVIAASLTTVIAFGGLTAVGGRFGDMIADIPWTVIAVLIASVIECFLILPNHMAHALAGAAKEHWYDWPSRMVNRGFDWFRDRVFLRFMHLVIRARYVVLAGLVVLLAWGATAFLGGTVTWRFFSSPEQGTLRANFVMTSDATREDTMAVVRELQRAASALSERLEAEHGAWPVASILAEVGANSGRGLAASENRTPDQLGSLTIDLIDADNRPYSSFEFTAMLQDEVREHPLLEELSFRSYGMGPGGDSLSVDLIGGDAETLKAAAEALKALLEAYPIVTGLEDTLAYDKEELVLELTPQGQALGFSTDILARELRQRLSGIEAAVFPDGVRSAEIWVRLPESERAADFLESTLLRSEQGRYLPLGDIVRVRTQQGFSAINRENGLQLVTVSGTLDEEDAAAASALLAQLETEILPQLASDFGVTFRLSGLSEQEDQFLSDAALGAMICLIAIYLVLAWVFSSWLRPLIVMSVIPFGMIGVIYGHAAWNIPLTMFSVVGIIGMAGIIINDSIVLVTTVDDYAKDRGLLPSIADAAADRLRPVFLTTATTVMGLGPLLFERSNDAQFLRPTVVTLAYGLGFGMFLVLLIVPSLLAAGHDMSRAVRSLKRALRMPRAQVGAGLRALPWLAAGLVAVAFALTMGWTLVTQQAGPLTALVLPGAGGMAPAFGVFLTAVGGGVLALWGLGGLLTLLPGRRRALPPAAE